MKAEINSIRPQNINKNLPILCVYFENDEKWKISNKMKEKHF